MRRLATVALVASLALGTGGCKCLYCFSGGGLPDGVKTVAIIPFENETTSTDLPRELTEALREGLEKRLGLRSGTEDKAHVIVRGKIVTYDLDIAVAVSAGGEANSARRKLAIVLDIELVQQSDGTVLWQRSGLRAEGQYPERGEATGRKQAIDRIVADVIEGAQSKW